MSLNALPGLSLSTLILHNASLVPLLYSTSCPPSQMWYLSSLDIWALLVPRGHFPHSTLHCGRLSVHHLLPWPTIKTFFMLSSQLYFFFFFAMLYGKWDLSFPTKDYTHAPALEAWSLNHWTSRRVPPTLFMEPHYGQISSRDLKGNVMKIYIKFFLPAYHNQCCRSNNST